MINTKLLQIFHKDYSKAKAEVEQLKLEILDIEITLKQHYKNLILAERKLEALENRAIRSTIPCEHKKIK